MPRISYSGSVLPRYEAEAALVLGINAAVSDGVNRIMTAEENLSLIVGQSDPMGSYLGTKGGQKKIEVSSLNTSTVR